MKKLFILLLISAMICGCKGDKTNSESTDIDTTEDIACCCPCTIIYLQPLGDYSQKEAEKMKADIKKHYEDFGSVEIEDIRILPTLQLTNELMNETHTRYRAEKIIHYLEKNCKLDAPKGMNTQIIGLTHKDISTSAHGKNDWGVLGLAYMPGSACIISTYRIRNNADFWKVAAHEFCHSFWGAPHCQEDDPRCILKDAKGKYTPDKAVALCDSCKGRY